MLNVLALFYLPSLICVGALSINGGASSKGDGVGVEGGKMEEGT